MTITLTPQQQKRLEDEVAAGNFASVEEALDAAIAGLMHAPDTQDLDWAKPYLDRARAEIEQGKIVTLEDFNNHVDAKLKSLR